MKVETLSTTDYLASVWVNLASRTAAAVGYCGDCRQVGLINARQTGLAWRVFTGACGQLALAGKEYRDTT
jgi:hypothetical protein